MNLDRVFVDSMEIVESSEGNENISNKTMDYSVFIFA